MTRLTIAALLFLCGAAPARAQDVVEVSEPLVTARATPIADTLAAEAAKLAAAPQDDRPVAIEYSDAHETRAKIHKYVSWATIPLMATEFALGQKLYDDPNSINSRSEERRVGKECRS